MTRAVSNRLNRGRNQNQGKMMRKKVRHILTNLPRPTKHLRPKHFLEKADKLSAIDDANG
jgi:hypothetical protein